MKIIIFGPQGSGKGTQAELIASRYGLPYISTGDIFRFHIKNNTSLGEKVSRQIAQGHLIDDEITNQIVRLRLEQPDCNNGFVLDGYPRNKLQADFLDSITKIDLVIVIDIADQQAIERLSGRLACKCGLSYHLLYNPPAQEGVCNKCGDRLFKRDDDSPKSIAKRLAIYHQETEPLYYQYQQQGIFNKINGDREIEEVYRNIEEIVIKYNHDNH